MHTCVACVCVCVDAGSMHTHVCMRACVYMCMRTYVQCWGSYIGKVTSY